MTSHQIRRKKGDCKVVILATFLFNATVKQGTSRVKSRLWYMFFSSKTISIRLALGRWQV